MRLHVRVIGIEQLLHTIDRELLYLIDDFAAAVIALSRKTFRVFVGERSAHRFEHRLRHEILTRDQLEAVALPIDLLIDEPCDIRIRLSDVPFRHRAATDAPLRWCLSLWHQVSFGSILFTRRSWRPPSNLVSSHSFMVLMAMSSVMKRAGSTSTFESLCFRDNAPISGSHARAARTPGCLLATMSMPTPLPQSRIPRFASPFDTSRATGCPKSG